MTTETENTVRRALAYASHGWPVFPCQPGGKEPATRHGFHDATTSPDRIRSWWRRQPAANLAIATGRPGPDVLDIDQHGDAGSRFARPTVAALGDLSHLAAWVGRLQEGNRNSGLYWAACRAVEAGQPAALDD